MKKYLIILTLAGLFAGKPTFGQAIRGGEIWVRADLQVAAQAWVVIYRQDAGGASTLLFNWGDGTIDTLEGQTALTPIPDIVADNYHGVHLYPGPGTYTFSATDSFLIADIANIPNSGQQSLTLQDTFVIPEILFNSFGIPAFNQPFTSIDIDENGVVKHHTILYVPLNYFDSIRLSLVPFPVEGYTFPEATDTLRCCFVWDRPTAPGRYALAIKARCWYQGQVMATATRAMVIDIDSVVSSVAPQLMEQTLEVYPNPVSETLHLAWLGGESTPAILTVANALGQVLLQERIDLATGGEEIDVRGWPPGLYVVQIAAGGGQVVRKVMVGR